MDVNRPTLSWSNCSLFNSSSLCLPDVDKVLDCPVLCGGGCSGPPQRQIHRQVWQPEHTGNPGEQEAAEGLRWLRAWAGQVQSWWKGVERYVGSLNFWIYEDFSSSFCVRQPAHFADNNVWSGSLVHKLRPEPNLSATLLVVGLQIVLYSLDKSRDQAGL